MAEVHFFDYGLPQERIAQWPAAVVHGRRDCAKLLHVQKIANTSEVTLADRRFDDLAQILHPGDLLVLNDSQVSPRRLFGHHATREVEVLLIKELSENGHYSAKVKPLKRLRDGAELCFANGLSARLIERSGDTGHCTLEFRGSNGALATQLGGLAVMPIPPYIRKGRAEQLDCELYQTVYASVPGSIAAPTAGLHFTGELLTTLRRGGVEIVFVTLHIGAFSIVDADRLPPAGEEYYVSPDTWQRICKAKEDGRRIVAVGTTAVRALESIGPKGPSNCFEHTDLIIEPGYRFRVVDALITNFHQPRSSHLKLVTAFFGAAQVRKLYEHALRGSYQFLSYGDSMLLEAATVCL